MAGALHTRCQGQALQTGFAQRTSQTAAPHAAACPAAGFMTGSRQHNARSGALHSQISVQRSFLETCCRPSEAVRWHLQVAQDGRGS